MGAEVVIGIIAVVVIAVGYLLWWLIVDDGDI
jgi:hypothetical protein